MKKLVFALLLALAVFSPLGSVQAAQEIQTAFGPRPTFQDSFRAAVGESNKGNLVIFVTLTEKPDRPVSLAISKIGQFASSLTTSPAVITINENNWNSLNNILEVTYDGSGEVGRSASIFLSGSGLSKRLTVTAVESNGDFFIGGGSSNGGSTSGTNDPGGSGSTGSSPSGSAATTVDNPPSGAEELFRCGAGTVGGRCGMAEYIAEPTGFVYQSWRVTRSIINILLILALLVISFSNITRISIDTYTIKKALPNLILGVILANASFLIVRYLADLATVATYLFVDLAIGPDKEFSQFISLATAQLTKNSILTVGSLSVILLIPAIIVVIVLLLWLAFLLYFRLVAVYLLTILAPLAFVAYGIPGLEKYFKMWWQQMIKWMFMVPAMAAVFWLMIEIGRATGSQSVARLLIMFVLFFIACTIPSRFGGAVIDKASGVFKKYSGLDYAKQKLGEKLGEAGQDMKERAGLRWQQAWRRAPIGKQLATYAEKRALDKENMKKDVELLRQEAATRARRGRAGASEAALATREQRTTDELAAIKAQRMTGFFQTPQGKEELKKSIRSELEKRSAESERDNIRVETKIAFMNKDVNKDEKDKELIKKMYQSVFNLKRSGDQLELDDSIATGVVAHERIQPLQALENFDKHMKEYQRLSEDDKKGAPGVALLRAMAAERKAFKAMQQKKEYKQEFGDLSFDGALKEFTEGKTERAVLWKATHSRGRRIFNEGILKQNEILLKEGTASEITGEMDAIRNKLEDQFGKEEAKVKMKLLLEGNTAELQRQLEEAEAAAGDDFKGPKMRDILLATELQKKVMAQPGDYRNREILEHFVGLNNEVYDGVTEKQFDLAQYNLGTREGRSQLSRVVLDSVGAVHGAPNTRLHKGGHVIQAPPPGSASTAGVASGTAAPSGQGYTPHPDDQYYGFGGVPGAPGAPGTSLPPTPPQTTGQPTAEDEHYDEDEPAIGAEEADGKEEEK